MVAKEAADLVMKVGGVGSVVGAIIGAVLWSSTTCSGSPGSSTPSCSNVFGEVATNALGQPNWAALIGIGALVGAVVGGGLCALIAKLWPSTKPDLFP